MTIILLEPNTDHYSVATNIVVYWITMPLGFVLYGVSLWREWRQPAPQAALIVHHATRLRGA